MSGESFLYRVLHLPYLILRKAPDEAMCSPMYLMYMILTSMMELHSVFFGFKSSFLRINRGKVVSCSKQINRGYLRERDLILMSFKIIQASFCTYIGIHSDGNLCNIQA
jgi:hypothetical protein